MARKPKPYTAKTLSGAQAYARMLVKLQARTAALLDDYAVRLKQAEADRRTLAKLAAEGAAFYNPLIVWEAKALRDRILRAECNLNPDGSPIPTAPVSPSPPRPRREGTVAP